MGFSASVCHPEAIWSWLSPLLCNGWRLHCAETDADVPWGVVGIRSLSRKPYEDPGKLQPPLSSRQLLGSSSTVTLQLQRNSFFLVQSAQWPGYQGQAHSSGLSPLGITWEMNNREQAEHEVIHGALFKAGSGLEFCRTSSNTMVISSQP